MLTERESRYVIVIYDSYLRGIKEVGPKYVAELMKVKRPTAYEMLNRLREKNVLERNEGRYKFTEKGLLMARRIIRNHRVIETMLYRAGIELERACELASRIQGELDDDSVEVICRYLGNPRECPHGRPIPEVNE